MGHCKKKEARDSNIWGNNIDNDIGTETMSGTGHCPQWTETHTVVV
jgi:hypothetical protein